MKRSPSTVKLWCVAAFVGVVAIGFAYLGVQQDYRLSANDPQEQLAHDAASALSSGASPTSVLGSAPTIDMAKSLSPFLIVYNQSHQMLASSGRIGTTTPSLPTGVFTNAASKGEDAFTWQPQSNVRDAAVVVHQGNYYVLSARSLSEVEQHETELSHDAAIAVVVLLVGLGVILWAF